MPSEFVPAVEPTDADVIEQEILDEIQAAFAEWSPAEAGLATILIKAVARLHATVKDTAATISAALFKTFGATIVRVPPILAAPATADSTWTMIDNAGYTIPAGTQVRIPAAGDESIGFEVAEEVVVAPGSTETAAGEVTLQAIEPGEAANGLTGTPSLLDSLIFVDSIALVGATSGGVEEEDEDAYLNRLTEAMQLLSDSPIVPRDWEIDALADAGVARALCLPGYNAETEEADQPLCVTVVPVDEDGLALSGAAKEKLQERQAEKVLSGVLNFVTDPTYTEVDVEAKFTVTTGNEAAATETAVEARLTEYLSPANWGLPSVGDASTSTGWVNQTKVYLNELISEVDRVAGVGRVISLKLVKGGGVLGTADITLAGVATLTKPGLIEATAE